jgi:CRP/FNR family transcriptional regulator
MDDWLKRFPTLAAMDRETARAVTREARVLSFPPDATVFTVGLPCENYLLVAQGVVRVQLRSEMGREIVLYRVADGETCILTTACLLADEAYGAEAITETEVLAIVLERTFFMRLLGLSEGFRRFVFHGHAARLTNMLLLMEEVGVHHLETRLARLLLENQEGRARPLGCRRLARELDTAQASLKLSLDDFARRGWVRLTRERVEVLDPERLKLFAENAVSDRA